MSKNVKYSIAKLMYTFSHLTCVLICWIDYYPWGLFHFYMLPTHGPPNLWPHPIPPQWFFVLFFGPTPYPLNDFYRKKIIKGGGVWPPYISPQWFFIPDKSDPPPFMIIDSSCHHFLHVRRYRFSRRFCRKSTHISMPCYISKEAHNYGLLFHNTVVGHPAMI